MTAATLDFIKENSIEIGSTFEATIQLCDAPDLTNYTGLCYVKVDENSTDSILTPTILSVSHNLFVFNISSDSWTGVVAGLYKYDVLFSSVDGNKFYAVRGVINLIKPITRI
jgi:hypothetical protein